MTPIAFQVVARFPGSGERIGGPVRQFYLQEKKIERRRLTACDLASGAHQPKEIKDFGNLRLGVM